MKTIIGSFLTIVALLIIACNNPKKNLTENPYVGAWEMTYSKYIYPDTTYETSQFVNPTVKLLTNKHYAFGRQDGENQIRGGGGEYSYNGDVFTSYPKYHSSSAMVDDSIVFKSKIEGDFWTVSFTGNLDTIKVVATETWMRIKE